MSYKRIGNLLVKTNSEAFEGYAIDEGKGLIVRFEAKREDLLELLFGKRLESLLDSLEGSTKRIMELASGLRTDVAELSKKKGEHEG